MIVLADLVPRIIRDDEKTRYEAEAFVSRKQEAFDNGEVFPHLLEVDRLLKDISSILRQTDQQKEAVEEHEEIKKIHVFEDFIEHEQISTKEITAVTQFLQDFQADLRPVYEDGKATLKAAQKLLSVGFVSPIPATLDSGFLALDRGCIYPQSQPEEAGHMILRYERAPVVTKSSTDSVYRQLDCKFVDRINGSVASCDIRDFLVSEDYIESGEPLLLVKPQSEKDNAEGFAFNETVEPVGAQLVNKEIEMVARFRNLVGH